MAAGDIIVSRANGGGTAAEFPCGPCMTGCPDVPEVELVISGVTACTTCYVLSGGHSFSASGHSINGIYALGLQEPGVWSGQGGAVVLTEYDDESCAGSVVDSVATSWTFQLLCSAGQWALIINQTEPLGSNIFGVFNAGYGASPLSNSFIDCTSSHLGFGGTATISW